jgi:hypothetical protein
MRGTDLARPAVRLGRLASAVLVVAIAAMVAPPITRSRAAEPEAKTPTQSNRDAKKPGDSSALDDALLKDLDNELLEGAGDLKSGKAERPKPAKDKSPAPQDDPGQDVGMPGEDADPLERIGEQMRSVEKQIPEQSKRPSTEQLQRRIVDDLAGLVEQAEKRSAAKSSSQGTKSQPGGKRQMVQQPKGGKPGGNSSKPAKDSTDRLSKADAERPDPEMRKSLLKEAWGHLPAHTRELMLQSPPEQFLPQYELMIERYYKRLAEEQLTK